MIVLDGNSRIDLRAFRKVDYRVRQIGGLGVMGLRLVVRCFVVL